jgi:hypothetical protein
MTLIDWIEKEMMSDDDNREKQSALLERTYRNATMAQREALDDALISLCGWSLGTALLRHAEQQEEEA